MAKKASSEQTELNVLLRPSSRGSYEGVTVARLTQTHPTILDISLVTDWNVYRDERDQ